MRKLLCFLIVLFSVGIAQAQDNPLTLLYKCSFHAKKTESGDGIIGAVQWVTSERKEHHEKWMSQRILEFCGDDIQCVRTSKSSCSVPRGTVASCASCSEQRIHLYAPLSHSEGQFQAFYNARLIYKRSGFDGRSLGQKQLKVGSNWFVALTGRNRDVLNIYGVCVRGDEVTVVENEKIRRFLYPGVDKYINDWGFYYGDRDNDGKGDLDTLLISAEGRRFEIKLYFDPDQCVWQEVGKKWPDPPDWGHEKPIKPVE